MRTVAGDIVIPALGWFPMLRLHIYCGLTLAYGQVIGKVVRSFENPVHNT